MGLFHYDSPFVEFVNKIIDLILLNALFLLGSIPLVTVGTAQTALYAALHQHFACNAPIFSTFWRAYLSNLKQSTALWLLTVCIHVLGMGGILYYAHSGISPFLLVLQIVLYLLGVCIASWLFPLQARFSNTIKNTVYNAFCCAISGIPETIGAIILRTLPILLFFFSPSVFIYLLPFLFLIWFSLSSGLVLRLFRKKLASMEKLAEKHEAN